MPRQQPRPPTFDVKRAKYQNQLLRKRIKSMRETFANNPADMDKEYRALKEELQTYRIEEDMRLMEQEILDHQFKSGGLPPRVGFRETPIKRGKY